MKKPFSIRNIILAASLLLHLGTLCFHAHGAAGDVDLSFDPGSGVNGQVTALVVQPDGKVVIGGSFTTVKGLARRGIARLNADGSGDSSFTAADYGSPYALALQLDGKVLVGTYSGFVRLHSDGSLDNTFSASVTSFDEYGGVYSIAVQSDGKILIGGGFTVVNGTNRFGIARLNANGTLDNSFDPGTGAYGVGSIAVQPDGRVLIGGWFQAVNGTNRDGIARLNANGSLDGSFNPTTGPNSWVQSLAFQPDGKVVVAGGFITVNGTNGNGIARLNANGSLDNSFNPGAVLTNNHLTYVFMIYSLAVQADGKVVIGGSFSVNATNSNNIARFNANGTLDGGFNPGTGAGGEVYAVAAQPDGRVLIGGAFTTVQGNIRNHIARFNAGGSLNGSFSSSKEIGGQVSAVAVQPDGKVLLGGWFDSVQGTNRSRIARLNANGSLDSTFDPGTGANGEVKTVALQADGKVLIGGSFTSINGTNCYSVARLNPNGSLEAGFQPDLWAFNHWNDCPPGYSCSSAFPETTAILVQPDGKIIIGGSFITIVWPVFEGEDTLYLYRHFLGRFNPNGSRDTSFNFVTNLSTSWNSMSSLALQPDGKVLVAGNLYFNGTNYILARFSANGSLDNSFNSLPGGNGISSVALQPDGKVLIGGGFYTVHGVNRPQLARLHANGNLDSSFNPGSGPGAAVYSMALQPDGKVLIGRDTAYDGTNYNTITRRNADGSLDPSFKPGSGASGAVRVITLQPNGDILIGGSFTTVNGVVRPRVARLYGDAAPPTLNIARSNAFVIVSWPASSFGFVLQQNTNLNSIHWTTPSESVTDNGTIKSISVSPAPGNRYYRLFKP